MTVIKNTSLRTILRIVIPFIFIPAVAILGVVVFDEKKHVLLSFATVLLTLLLFVAGIEKKSVGTRRTVLAAVMIALCIVGRFIPLFKPITAITVISAIYLGKETGFTVGALAAFLSNFYFGQGPWTPFQMLAWGLIGFFAGVLSKPLQKSRLLLVAYGVMSGLVFSLVMDVWTVIWHYNTLTTSYFLAAIATALPHTLLYSVSNLIFLWLMAKPFGEKLGRIKLKYDV